MPAALSDTEYFDSVGVRLGARRCAASATRLEVTAGHSEFDAAGGPAAASERLGSGDRAYGDPGSVTVTLGPGVIRDFFSSEAGRH